MSLNSDIVFANKVDLIGDQYFKRSKSNFGEVGFLYELVDIKKEKGILSILNFGIEDELYCFCGLEHLHPGGILREGQNSTFISGQIPDGWYSNPVTNGKIESPESK